MSPHIKLFTQIVKLISLTLKNKYYDKKNNNNYNRSILTSGLRLFDPTLYVY